MLSSGLIPEGIGWLFYGVEEEEEEHLIDEILKREKPKHLHGFVSLETQRFEVYEPLQEEEEDLEMIGHVLYHFQWKNLEKLLIFHTNQAKIDFNRLMEEFQLTNIVEYHVILPYKSQDMYQHIQQQLVWKYVAVNKNIKKESFDGKIIVWILYNCMKTLELLVDQDEKFNRFQLTFGSQVPTKTLRMNIQAQKSLVSFFLQVQQQKRPTTIDFYRFLNRCHTIEGNKCLRHWMEYPSMDPEILQERHEIIEQFLTDRNNIRMKIETFLMTFPHSFLHRHIFSTRSLQLDHIQVFHHFLQVFLEFIEQIDLTFVCKIHSFGHTLRLFGKTIENELTRRKTSVLRDNPTLEHEKQNLNQEIENLTVFIAKEIGLARKKIKIILSTGNAYGSNNNNIVWKISRNEAHRITRTSDSSSRSTSTSTITRFFLLKTLVSGILFTCSRLEEISSKLQAIEKRKEEIELETLYTLKEIGRQETNQLAIDQLFDVIGEMDALLSLALVAYDHGLVRPQIIIDKENREDLVCHIQGAFHPLFRPGTSSASELLLTCTLRKNKSFGLIQKEHMSRVQERGMYLLGLVLWMYQIGGFVPCQEMKITRCFDAIFVRYGTRDAQFYGHSTFMTEMLDIAAILKRCSASSLVLMDELCWGTAQEEAVALGYAICSELIERQTTCILATSNETLQELLTTKLEDKIVHLFDDQQLEPKKKSQQEKDESFFSLLEECEFPEEACEYIRYHLIHKKPKKQKIHDCKEPQ